MSVIADWDTLTLEFVLVDDPTTAGVSDSRRAMGYEEPWEDKK